MKPSPRAVSCASVLLLLSLSFAGCSSDDSVASEPVVPTPTATPVPQPAPDSPVATGDGETTDVPLPQTLSLASVVMSVNGALNEGSGVAFLSEAGVHARLLVGPPNEYLQFDLVAGPDDGTVGIAVGTTMPGVIYGQDAVSQNYTVVEGAASNSFSLSHNVPAIGDDSVEGTLDVMVQHANGETFRMTASFLLPASGGTDWNCDWQGPVVADCKFIEV